MAKTAIDAPRFDAFWLEPERLTLITDKASPYYQDRVEWPPDEGLVLSMMSGGFIDPITVFKDGDRIVVLDGRQRTKAAVEANKRLAEKKCEPIKVSVLLKRGTEADLYAVQCAANENRRDASDVERAKMLSRLMAYGRTEEQAGATLGLNAPKTKRILSLLDCAPAVQKAVESGRLSASAASKLAKLPREEQVKELDAALAEGAGKPTVAKVTRAVKAAQGESTTTPPSRKALRAALKRVVEDVAYRNTAVEAAIRWAATGEVEPGSAFSAWLAPEPSDAPPAES